jgi:hypothetical protein
MDPTTSCCFCWLGAAAWPLAGDDRFCSLCGQRLASVEPCAPVLATPSGVPAVIAYLEEEDAGELAGCLEFRLGGRVEYLTPVWEPEASSASSVSHWERPSHDALVLRVRAPAPASRASGELGRARLELRLPADRFTFEVRLYALGALRPHAWLSRADANGHGNGNGTAETNWVLFRDAADCVLSLRCELGEGIPVQLERVDCRHQAVTLRPTPEPASLVSQTEVHWDVSRLRRDAAHDQVPFRLHLRGLGPVEIEPRILWRQRKPLRCNPAALTVPVLTAGQDQEHLVQVTNADFPDLLIERVESSAPWVEAAPGEHPSFLLRPGESRNLVLRLRGGEAGGPPPYRAAVTFHFRGLGKQTYDVCAERVRIPRRLAGPLLIDPGPPRVVVAYHDPDSGELTYLPGAGTIGLAPEALGLTAEEYGRAVHRPGQAGPVLARLVRAAYAQALSRGPVSAGEVRLVGRPWGGAAADLPGVRRVDGLALCRRVVTDLGRPADTRVLLLEAWGVWFVPPPPPGEWRPQVQRSRGVTQTLGAGVVRCLLRQLRRHRPHRERPWPDEAQFAWAETSALEVPAEALWLQSACETLLADYAWGADHAWDALLGAVQERLTAARRCPLDRATAVADFDRELDRHLQLLGRTVGERPRVFLSPLFAQAEVAQRLQAGEALRGLPVALQPPRWLEWAASRPGDKVTR